MWGIVDNMCHAQQQQQQQQQPQRLAAGIRQDEAARGALESL
jgi:hypothetical protein